MAGGGAGAMGSVAGTGVVREGKLRSKTGTPWAGEDGNGHGVGAGYRAGGKFLLRCPGLLLHPWERIEREAKLYLLLSLGPDSNTKIILILILKHRSSIKKIVLGPEQE